MRYFLIWVLGLSFLVRVQAQQSQADSLRAAFGNLTIEELTAIDNAKRKFEYIQLQGLPVTDYKANVYLVGDNECTLNWDITYTDSGDDKSQTANSIAGFFVTAMENIAKELGIN